MICFTGCVAACVSPERATDYRQVVECAARNPCKYGKRISNPDGVTEFCRAFGTFKIFAFIAGVSPRFTACLCSVQAFGLPSTLARDSPPSEATGVFRAATGVAAAPQRGANPSFATEGRQGVGSLSPSARWASTFIGAANSSRSSCRPSKSRCAGQWRRGCR